MKVLLLSRYGPLGASSRVRMFQYLPYLHTQGIMITIAPLLSDAYLRRLYSGRRRQVSPTLAAYLKRIRDIITARKYDLVWMEKEVLPWLPVWLERWLNRLGIPYIVDYDDAIFHKYDQHRLRIVRGILGKKIDEVMQGAAVVVAGNSYLAERAIQAGAKRVEIVPSAIDLDRYCTVEQAEPQPFTIGWMGTPITSPYLRSIESAISDVCQGDAARLVTVGSGDFAFSSLPHEVRSWSEETEAADLRSFDCGIMPLPDASWERGKCGYKLIQYMASGLPVVASPVGVNREIVDHNENGFLAASREEWVGALTALRDDVDLCERMGAAARAKVVNRYCIQVTGPLMLNILTSAMDISVKADAKEPATCVD